MTIANYSLGLALQSARAEESRKKLLAAIIAFNIAVLLYYKRAYNPVLKLIVAKSVALGLLDQEVFDPSQIHLPLGISFFLFAIIAYHVDIYRRETGAERNAVNFGLYVSHFSKIMAGPIVRYRDMSTDLESRAISLESFSYGIRRFVVGFLRKSWWRPPRLSLQTRFSGAQGGSTCPRHGSE